MAEILGAQESNYSRFDDQGRQLTKGKHITILTNNDHHFSLTSEDCKRLLLMLPIDSQIA